MWIPCEVLIYNKLIVVCQLKTFAKNAYKMLMSSWQPFASKCRTVVSIFILSFLFQIFCFLFFFSREGVDIWLTYLLHSIFWIWNIFFILSADAKTLYYIQYTTLYHVSLCIVEMDAKINYSQLISWNVEIIDELCWPKRIWRMKYRIGLELPYTAKRYKIIFYV